MNAAWWFVRVWMIPAALLVSSSVPLPPFGYLSLPLVFSNSLGMSGTVLRWWMPFGWSGVSDFPLSSKFLFLIFRFCLRSGISSPTWVWWKRLSTSRKDKTRATVFHCWKSMWVHAFPNIYPNSLIWLKLKLWGIKDVLVQGINEFPRSDVETIARKQLT